MGTFDGRANLEMALYTLRAVVHELAEGYAGRCAMVIINNDEGGVVADPAAERLPGAEIFDLED